MASQKFGFVTVDPVSGSGDQAVNFSGEKHTGRLQRTINLTVTTNGGAKKALVVNQAAAAEVVRSDSPNASVQKAGGNVTITGKSNSTKLTFRSRRLRRTGLRYSSRLTTRRLERLRLTERLSPTIPEPLASSFGASRSRTYRPTSRSMN